MTELLRQVEEIRRRAHVCPDCGAMRAEHPDHRILCANPLCKDGQVAATDTDALCSALVTLAQAVEKCDPCKVCSAFAYCGDGGERQVCNMWRLHYEPALTLLRDGMPQPTSVCNTDPKYSTDSGLSSPTLQVEAHGRTTLHESGSLNTGAVVASCSDNSERKRYNGFVCRRGDMPS
jgi:hypothetical protein